MKQEEGPAADLRALRHAADRGDWNGCCDAARALLRRISPAEAMQLAFRHLECRLPAFERHQPGVTWPRQFLDSLRKVNSTEENPWKWPSADEFPGPGANDFLGGLEDLWQARRLPMDDPRRVDACVDVLQSSIQTEQTEAWGARHPEQWRYWYESATRGEEDPERWRIRNAWWRDPESVRIRREGWHEVADRLAEALGLPPGR